MKLLTTCALGITFGLATFPAETKLKVEDLPPAVKSAMKDQIKGATVTGASKEREHGRLTYEVETTLDGKGRDLTFDENGSLLEVEQETDFGSIPEPAKRAIQKKSANGVIEKVESVTQGSRITYEAQVRTKSGTKQEVAVNPDGSVSKAD